MRALIFLICLTLLVVTHELGHLFFAKLFHTRVSRFYVFFNWKFSIFKAKKFNGKWHFLFFNSITPDSWDEKNLRPEDQNNTLWGLGWIPLGGYCDIAGMIDETKGADDLESTPQPWEYRTKPGWQRLCIISGGVLVNFISALIIYAAIFSHWGTDELPLRNARLGYEYSQVMLDEGFQNGDIIYAKVNDLLPKDAAVPTGHTATKNGSYYTVWMVVRDVDYTTNTLTVTLYNSLKPNGDPAVPGGYNFTPYGTPIQGTDDPSVAIADERAIVVDGHTLDETGFDCCITVTRHGNIADGVNPDTGETDDQIRQRQEDRAHAGRRCSRTRRRFAASSGSAGSLMR